MDNVIELQNGGFLWKDYGKYMPNLCILNETPIQPWEEVSPRMFNMPAGYDIKIMRGTYYVSKKGTHCFKCSADGPHVLVENHWGGVCRSPRCLYLDKDSALYFRSASSNGGKNGYDYYVLPADWKYVVSEEDL